MHLQSHGRHATLAPSLARRLPAKIKYPHSADTVASNALTVFSSLGSEVEVIDSVLEYPQRCFEVIKTARATGRYWRGTDQRQFSLDGLPKQEHSLNVWAAVHHDQILIRQLCQSRLTQRMLNQINVALRFHHGELKSAIDRCRINSSQGKC